MLGNRLLHAARLSWSAHEPTSRDAPAVNLICGFPASSRYCALGWIGMGSPIYQTGMMDRLSAVSIAGASGLGCPCLNSFQMQMFPTAFTFTGRGWVTR